MSERRIRFTQCSNLLSDHCLAARPNGIGRGACIERSIRGDNDDIVRMSVAAVGVSFSLAAPRESIQWRRCSAVSSRHFPSGNDRVDT